MPTGPRNKNKYKDIDGSAPAVEGLDYGGGGGKESRTPPDYDDRSSRLVVSSTLHVPMLMFFIDYAGSEEARLGWTTAGAPSDDSVRHYIHVSVCSHCTFLLIPVMFCTALHIYWHIQLQDSAKL